MKKDSKYGVILLVILLQLGFIFQSVSQVQTARYISTSANSHGFYEFLPAGYRPTGPNVPLIVFLHGSGERGNGVSNLPLVLRNGPPKIAAAGGFNASYNFIIISPQFVDWPSSQNVDDVIEYAKSHYRVDVKRIYLTGLSMGGGAVWQYAGDPNLAFGKKIAAIVPVCGASYPDKGRASRIAKENIAVWATHNEGDPTVPVAYTNGYVANINSQIPAPSPLAKKTIFPVNGHDAWSTTYSLSFTENGMNVYQWMLQYQNVNLVLPIVLGDYKASLETNGAIAIQWNTVSEINNKNFVIEKSLDGNSFSLLQNVAATNEPSGHDYSIVDNKPSPGNNFYRLAQVDIDGKTTYFNILKVNVPLSDNQRYIHLSPNPVVNTLMLELINPAKGAIQVSLTDIQGHQLKIWKFQKSSLSWQQSIDVSGIPKGNYIIRISGNNLNELQRFVKQ